MERLKKWLMPAIMPRWYWILYWTGPLLFLALRHHQALQVVAVGGWCLLLVPLMFRRAVNEERGNPYFTALAFIVLAAMMFLLVSCAATEPRRTCSNWTNLTWTGGRIIGRAAYTPITSCAPGGLEGTGSSLTYYPAEEESRFERENHPLP
jgi:quinol-cytochrome oxidoreductase complex cytochrome b subunit